jgi:uncharacterized repeat protein (TIGR01451 family)
MRHSKSIVISLIFASLIPLVVRAGTLAWSTEWLGGSLSQWTHGCVGGSCTAVWADGASYGGVVGLRATHPGTQTSFGYEDKDFSSYAGTDMRVQFRFLYTNPDSNGTSASYLSGTWGYPMYYNVSANSSSGTITTDPGSPNYWNLSRHTYSFNPTSWTKGTVDYVCSGKNITWWRDSTKLQETTSGTVVGPSDDTRPRRFMLGDWQGGQYRTWSEFMVDYIYWYHVDSPSMLTPSVAGLSVTGSWTSISAPVQPDGTYPSVSYYAEICSDSACSSVVSNSGWTSSTSHTFSGLQPNTTYYLRVTGRWNASPELITCPSSAVPASTTGNPVLTLSKTATTTAGPGSRIDYTVTVGNSGSSAATGVTVTDSLPNYLTNVVIDSGSGSVSGSTITFSVGALDPGGSVELRFHASVSESIPQSVSSLTNSASAQATNGGGTPTASASTTILHPEIVLSKTAPAEVGAGQTISYQLTVSNPGDADASGVAIVDDIPTLVLNPTNISAGGYVEGSQVKWNIGHLGAGDSQTMTWQGTVNSTATATDGPIVNTATATDIYGNSDWAQASTDILAPNLAISKHGPATISPGDSIQYTIIVTNTGSYEDSAVQVTDMVPAYILDVRDVSVGGVYSGGSVVWAIGTLQAGEHRTLTFRGTVDPYIPASERYLLNLALVDDGGGRSRNAQLQTTLVMPQVSFIKTGPQTIRPGGVLSYTISVQNTGGAAIRGAVVQDPIPNYVMSPTDISHGGVITGGMIVWALGDMSQGEGYELSWAGTLSPDIPYDQSQLQNRAIFLCALESMQRESVVNTLVEQPDVEVTKRATSPITPGLTIDYWVDVTNLGTMPVYHPRVEDYIPDHITVLPHTISDSGYEIPGAVVWESIGDLDVAETKTVHWQGVVDINTPPSVTEIENTARVILANGITREGSVISYFNPPGLELTKDATSSIFAGGQISYILRVKNMREGLARYVEVRDPLPAYLKYVPDVSGSSSMYGSLEGNTVVWRMNTLQPGEERTLVWEAEVDVNLPVQITEIVNTAAATDYDNPEPVSASATTAILSHDLQSETICTALVQGGDQVDYGITVTNAGTGTIDDVELRTPVPDGTTFLSASPYAKTDSETGEMVWELGTMAVGAVKQVSFSLRVDEGWSNGESLLETSRLLSNGQQVLTDGCQTSVAVPTLRVIKTGPAQSMIDDVIDYQIVVENVGQVPAENATLSDRMQTEGVTLLPGSASDGGYVQGTWASWQLGMMSVGDAVTRTIQAHVLSGVEIQDDQVVNRAEAVADRSSTAVSEFTTDISPASLGVDIEATEFVALGQVVEFSVAGQNNGPSTAYQTVLSVEMPEGIDVDLATVTDDGYYDATTNTLAWALGNVAPGGEVGRQYHGVALPSAVKGTPLESYAVMDASNTIPAIADAQTTVDESSAAMNGRKTASPEMCDPGGVIEYAIRAENSTAARVDGVVIRDVVPAYTTYLDGSASIEPIILDDDGNTLLAWNIGRMAPGEVREVRFRVVVAEKSAFPDWVDRITNVANVAYQGGDFDVRAVSLLPWAIWTPTPTHTPLPPPPPPPGPTKTPGPPPPPNPTATPYIPGTLFPPMLPTPVSPPELVKSVSPTQVEPGQVANINWVVKFENTLPYPVTNLQIRDPLPVGLEYLGVTLSQGEYFLSDSTEVVSQTMLVAQVGTVNPGSTASLVIHTRTVSDTQNGDLYINVAGFIADGWEGNSNEARVVVVGKKEILPVTGGLLDPATTEGKITWGVLLLGVATLWIIRRRRLGLA